MVDVETKKFNAKRKRGGPTFIKTGGVINQYPAAHLPIVQTPRPGRSNIRNLLRTGKSPNVSGFGFSRKTMSKSIFSKELVNGFVPTSIWKI